MRLKLQSALFYALISAMMTMTKAEALRHFDGNNSELARQVGINYQAVLKWPEKLPPRISDRVIVAMIRTGKTVPARLLKPLAMVRD